MILEVKAETRIENGTSSRWQPNQIVWFPKSDHPVSSGSGQKGTPRTTPPGMALVPHWFPLGLTSNQIRRIQRMTAQKMKEEAAEKERDKHFNDIRPVVPMRQEWRVKEKVDTPAPMTSDDDMDLLDDDVPPLIKGLCHRPTWTSTWCSRCRSSSGVSRRRFLRCVSALKRPCSKSLKSQAST
jgi:hypothetical protein